MFRSMRFSRLRSAELCGSWTAEKIDVASNVQQPKKKQFMYTYQAPELSLGMDWMTLSAPKRSSAVSISSASRSKIFQRGASSRSLSLLRKRFSCDFEI